MTPPPNSKAPRTTVAREGDAIVVRIETPAPTAAPDDLLAFPFGLEVSAARALVRQQTLRAAKIGRRLYAKRSDVLALIDKLATKSVASGDVQADYAALAQSARTLR